MNFETRLRTDIALTVDAMPGEVPDLADIVQRSRKRRSKRRIVAVISILAATTAMASVQIFGFTPGSEQISVTVAGRNMAYSELLSEDPVVVRGVPAPAPEFDTSSLGTEIPFVAADLPADIPIQLSRGGVFAGAVEGVPVFVYGERLGNEELFCVTTGSDSLCTEAAPPGGGVGASSEFSPSGEVIYGILLGDLPAEVSVVAYFYTDTGEAIGWQTPVAYVSYLPITDPGDLESDIISWDFYDAYGTLLGTFGASR